MASRKSYNKYMRSYHRKTLIRREQWPLIDGWYWCPIPSIEDRIQTEIKNMSHVKRSSPLWFSLGSWKMLQYKLEARLAHACDDGKIRAPSWVEYYRTKGGGVSIYGKCRHCEKSLSNGIKGIIILEKEL
jgi:hypothetical protein